MISVLVERVGMMTCGSLEMASKSGHFLVLLSLLLAGEF
jgi:hypothetical protein